MSYESSVEPVRIGRLVDSLLPEGVPATYFLIDRPTETIYGGVDGLHAEL